MNLVKPLFSVLCIIQGLLLVVAASAKLYLLMTDPFLDLHLNFPMWIIWVGVAVEYFVAFFALRYSGHPANLLPLFLLFSVFLVVSGARFLFGIEGCGCFEKLDIPHAALLVNDIVVLAVLLIDGVFTQRYSFGRCYGSTLSAWKACVNNGQQSAKVLGAVLVFFVFVVLQSSSVTRGFAGLDSGIRAQLV